MAKKKYYKVHITGTGLNERLLIAEHEILPFEASTYHKFTYPNGVTQLKNDFGVSTITLTPISLTEEEALALMEKMAQSF